MDNEVFFIDKSSLDNQQIIKHTFRGVNLVLLNYQGQLQIFQGDCPHEGADLSQGIIDDGHLVCPLHQWNFNCKTGKHNESNICLKKYDFIEKNNKIYVFAKDFPKLNNLSSIKTIKDLPSPKGQFLLGNLKDFKATDKHLVLENWVKTVGELFKISLLGKDFIVSANTELNSQILKSRPTKFRRFNKIQEIMYEMGIKGVFGSEGEEWVTYRKITAEALNVKNTRAYFPYIHTISKRLLNKLLEHSLIGNFFDIQKQMMRFTVDVTTQIAFGYDGNTLEKDDDVIQNHLEKIFPMINKRITAPFPFWRYFKSKADKELDFSLKEVEATVNTYIQEAKKRIALNPDLRENPSNFLESLLVQQELEGNFSDKDIYGNVLIILLAGEDTTSNSISWALYYLAQHPEMVQKIRNEANQVYSGDLPENYIQVSELKFAEAVSNEVIRIKPVTPTLYMQALENVEIDGFEIKKGQTVMMQNKVAQTSASNFFDPDQFIPERWLAINSTSTNKQGQCPFSGGVQKPEAILAFGGGARFCPGKYLAILEMTSTLSMICKNFDIELKGKPEDVKEVFAFTMYPDNLYIKLNKV
jgi:cytochrome P450/nitrite reductase/ring-hydroxylating ferredoxin subunit